MIKCTFEDGGQASLRHVVVDGIVTKENEILLVKRRKGFIEGGKWALIGGYVNRDETLIKAVEREILEETGWKVKNVELLRVVDNPNRPNEDRQNIAFVYCCEAVEQVSERDDESEEVRWFKFSELPKKEEIAFDHLDDINFYLSSKK